MTRVWREQRTRFVASQKAGVKRKVMTERTAGMTVTLAIKDTLAMTRITAWQVRSKF